jgi:hypothetical protein
MRIAGAVNHLRARRRDQRPAEREPHPVRTLHPCAIIAIARRLEARLHHQQLLDADAALRLGKIRKILRNRLLEGKHLAIDRNADEGRDDAFRNGFNIRRRRLPPAVEVPFENDAAALRDDQAMEAWQLFRGRHGWREHGWRRGLSVERGRRQEQGARERDPEDETKTRHYGRISH